MSKTMGTIKFVGAVSAQSAEGETVTISVTKPDSVVDVVTGVTSQDLSFEIEYENEAGSYSAVASLEADDTYDVAESDALAFEISGGEAGLLPRTITLALG